jgi:transitional endoplasmic reticulum ATPase
MNKGISKNHHVFLGDIVSIFNCSDCPDCSGVAILPFSDIVEGLSGDFFNIFLTSDFASTDRPVCKLGTFTISAGTRAVEFPITARGPGGYCLVTPSILLSSSGIF